MDDPSLFMFAVPLAIALVCTFYTFRGLATKVDLVSFFASLLGSIVWFIFGLTWAGIATEEILRSIAWLWYAVGTLFAVFSLYLGLRYLGAIFESKTPKPILSLQQSNEEE